MPPPLSRTAETPSLESTGKYVFKLASLNELEPYGNLNVAANSQCPARWKRLLAS